MSREHSGKLKQISRVLWSYVSIQGNILTELEKETQVGSPILAIRVHNKEEADLASAILQGHHAHHVQYFGPYGEVIESPP